MEKLMHCQICCEDGARIRRITETLGKGSDLLVVEDVPLVACPHCGESYFTAETLHELERIRLHRTSFAIERPIGVARFVA
jgi:YgiT-type zinc finger domain-containing protein